MGKITDLNIAGMEKWAFNSHLGDAHELLVTGILMRLGFDVAVANVKSGPYDLLIRVFTNFAEGKTTWIRGQVKTGQKSISFKAGSRGGVDREYISDVKVYKYTQIHHDLMIGVQTNTLDLYVIPTRFLRLWGDSRSFSKLKLFKNNWDILLNWNDEYLQNLEGKVSN